jgi:hypothetical protein
LISSNMKYQSQQWDERDHNLKKHV